MAGKQTGAKIIEGKTKIVFEDANNAELCIIESKDRITAGDGAKSHELEGKAEISTATNHHIYTFLNKSGIRTHYLDRLAPTKFHARRCHMIPIEFVTRRVATGSFLRRNPGVPEGYRFTPLKLETFFKDDANHDPQWSYEQLVSAKLKVGDRTLSRNDVDIMTKTTQTVFEILERAWMAQDCQLVDMKIEFGVDATTHEILLADVIDSDSWRLWPGGDKQRMVDKQVYRDMQNVTSAGLDTVKRNFRWVAEHLEKLAPVSLGRAVAIMGSASDTKFCEEIRKACGDLGVRCELRVSSAHKATDATMDVLSEYEASPTPVVMIAVAGRSNGLGPVISGNSALPVINCPPLSGDWGQNDVWSSLRLPSGLGCATVTSPGGAALAAAQILALSDHVIWARLRAKALGGWIQIRRDDEKMNS